MSAPERGWTMFCTEDAAGVLETMRVTGHAELHDQIVLFLRALATRT